ncbi:hypothetical protein [Streptomyces mirabilis]
MATDIVIERGDDRDTTYIVQTVPTSDGECSHAHGSCGKPGVLAVRNTVDQQRPTEVSTLRITLCADHKYDAPRLQAMWVHDAREMQDPIKRAAYLESVGVTD